MRNWKVVSCMLVVTLLAGMGMAFAADEDAIKIGAVFAVTGKASWLGEPEKNTAEMMVEEINAAGGVNGRKIDLIVKDSQGAPDRAVNAVRDLLRQKVVAIIGPSRSGTSMAVADICEQAEVPLISCAAAEEIVKGRKWVFKTPQLDSHVVEVIYDYMKAHDMKKVALITGTTGFGQAGRAKLQAQAEKQGIEIVGDETYGPGDKDMTPQLAKFKTQKPDAIVNWSIVPAQTIVMKNMKQLGMDDIQLFQSHGFGNYSYLKGAGDAAEGVLFPAGRLLVATELPDDNPQKELLVQFKTDYEERYDDRVSTFAGHALDALNLVVAACEKTDGSPAAIRDCLEGIQGFVGTGGIYNFSADDHTGLTKESLQMLTVKDGEFAIAPE